MNNGRKSQPDVSRRADGTIMKGSVLNPKGRPRREVEAEYLSATVESVTPEDWAKVVSSMLHFAKAGNVQAATWLGNYLVGKPTERIAIEADTNDTIELTWGVIGDKPEQLSDIENDDLPALSDGLE